MNLSELRELHSDDTDFAKAVIDECIFAFLVFYDGKINPLALKQTVFEHFELEDDLG